MSSRRATILSVSWDILSVVPGSALLLVLSWWAAIVLGLPIAVALIWMRRSWWSEHPGRGRVVVGILQPLFSVLVGMTLIFGQLGLLAGVLLGVVLLGLIEGWHRQRQGQSFVKRLPLASLLVLICFGAIFDLLLFNALLIRNPTEGALDGLSAPPDPPQWSAEAKTQAAAAIRQALEQSPLSEEQVAGLRAELQPTMGALAAAPSPHGIYVTLYTPEGFRSRGSSLQTADSLTHLLMATRDAVSKRPVRPRSSKKGVPFDPSRAAQLRLQIDLPGARREIPRRPVFYLFPELIRRADDRLAKLDPLPLLLNMAYNVESGVDGLEVRTAGDELIGVMLPAEPITEGWFSPSKMRPAPTKMRTMLRRVWRRQSRLQLDFDKTELTVYKFRTTSFGVPVPGGEVVDWYRGNRLLEGDLTREFLVERMILAADWLTRQIKEDGSFHYEIFPPYKMETRDYNLPRHAGSVYGLFAFANAAADEPAFRPAARRAVDAGLRAVSYIGESLKSPEPESRPEMRCFVDDKGKAKSGSTALAALALVELFGERITDDPALKSRIQALPLESWLRQMAGCMLEMIDARGAVFRYYKTAREKEFVEKEPLYFPGEVMLALVRMYKRLGDETYLEGAVRIANRQLGLFRWSLTLGIPQNGDHWIMQALSELARTEVEAARTYARLSVLMGRAYIADQHGPQDYLFPDYRGAYRRMVDVPRTTRAASRSEAVGGSMDAADFLGQDTTDFETSLIEAARHLLEQQFVPQNSYFIPQRFDVTGGIRMGIIDNHCRIDNNQHALVGLIRALQALDRRRARR